MIDLKTGVAVPLSALRTEQTPVVGDFTSLIEFSDFALEELETVQTPLAAKLASMAMLS